MVLSCQCHVVVIILTMLKPSGGSARRCAQMSMREMEGDRGLFKIAMSQQHLDGAQVGTGFQPMRCKPAHRRNAAQPASALQCSQPVCTRGTVVRIHSRSLSHLTVMAATS
jgi:hypothetical protein